MEDLLHLRALAKELYDLTCRWATHHPSAKCCDLRLLSCRLQGHALVSPHSPHLCRQRLIIQTLRCLMPLLRLALELDVQVVFVVTGRMIDQRSIFHIYVKQNEFQKLSRVRIFTCLTDVLLQQNLTEAGGEDPLIAKRERCSLCTSLCHTATAYQYANDLDAAIGACAEAAKQVEISVISS